MEQRSIYPKSRAHSPGVRWGGGAVVLALHGIVFMILLFHEHLKGPNPETVVEFHWIDLKPEKLAPVSSKVVLPVPRSMAVPAVTLSPPQFTVLSPEAPRPSPITVVPSDRASPAQGRRDYNDLFSADKKEQFKRFFNEQAIVDRRENAKLGNSKSPCDVFKKPDDLGAAGDLPSNGVTKNFKPGFAIGTGGSDDDGVSVRPCN